MTPEGLQELPRQTGRRREPDRVPVLDQLSTAPGV